MRMRFVVLASAVFTALATPSLRAQGEGFAGSWEAATPNGGTITLVLRQEGRRVLGTLSGNGNRFDVEAEIAADGGFYGTARSQAGRLFIGGERSGEQLGIALAELTAAGAPDLRNAQELRMRRVAAVADGSLPSSTGKPRGGAAAGAATGTGAGQPSRSSATAPNAAGGGSPADQQLTQLLLSSPWCNLRYSQQMGATTVERVVFSRDGRMVSRTQRESAVNNREGSYYGNSADATQGFWRVQGGNLLLSADGRAYEPTPVTVSRNSNGYPIVTAAGKEYYQCN